ncbi:uncharacterized protein LOC110706709 [Chenopodium quinoa]|nr:uncharacterized protein LOC110706709 [Chenopodium quinoa]
MEEKDLRHPLLPLANNADATITTTTGFVGPTSNDSGKTTSSRLSVIARLLVIFLIGAISIWASHEASKGFVITVVNNMKDTPAGEKFTLFFISNDEAIRLVQSSSTFAAEVLFPGDDSIPEKLIDQIDVQLVSHNLTSDHTVAVKSLGQKSKYILFINPLVMEFGNFRYRIRKEIQKGMAEILLFNRQHTAPKTLLAGMVEYISDLAGFGGPKPVFKQRDVSAKCWEEKDSGIVAKFLAYCEKKSKGFVGRLNQEMNRDGWYEKLMDKVLEMPAMHFCVQFHDFTIKNEDVTE